MTSRSRGPVFYFKQGPLANNGKTISATFQFFYNRINRGFRLTYQLGKKSLITKRTTQRFSLILQTRHISDLFEQIYFFAKLLFKV